MSRKRLLTDPQWSKIESLLPGLTNRGRPRCNNRVVLESILWILRSTIRWQDLPNEYHSASTCWHLLRK